ncbi:aldo/keto reductase [Dehalococcoidia bacterium]|nr:aldo/keto reductase [Dehalococcoidia bacterium]
MKYVNFGLGGVKVSPIALGLGFRGQTDPADGIRTINRAIDLGINLIDCANVYGFGDVRENAGTSEELLGRVLQTRRNEVVITSKVCSEVGTGPNDYGLSRYHIINQCEKSLSRLNTDRIDVYLFHMSDEETLKEEQFRALDDLIKQGKVLYGGVCNYQAWQVVEAINIQTSASAQPLITAQNPYNLLNRQLEDEFFPMVKKTGIGIMAYSPLAVGLLSGLYLPGKPAPQGSLWATVRKDLYQSYMRGQVAKIISEVQSVANELNATMAQVALSWVLSHPEITVAISGSDTAEHLDDVVSSAEIALPIELREKLSNVSKGLRLDLDFGIGEGLDVLE